MHKHATAILACAILLELSFPLRAKAEDTVISWTELMTSATAAYRSEDYATSAKRLRTALTMAKAINDLHKVMVTTRAFVALYMAERKYATGKEFCEAQLDFLERAHASASDIFPIVCDVGLFYDELGDQRAAERLLKQAIRLSMRRGTQAPADVLLAPSACLTKLYLQQKKMNLAVQSFETMMNFSDARGLPHDRFYAENLCMLGDLYMAAARYGDAVATYKRAALIDKSVDQERIRDCEQKCNAMLERKMRGKGEK